LEAVPEENNGLGLVGRAIRVMRAGQDMSRKELAKRAGLSYSYLAEIETGAKNPSSKALAQIAEALEVSLSTLHGAAERWASSPPPHSFEELRDARAAVSADAESDLDPVSASLISEPPHTQMYSASARRDMLHRTRRTRRRGREAETGSGESELHEALGTLRESDGGTEHAAELLQQLAQLTPEDRARLLDLAQRLTNE
jgi:transcriptional regulator with XRE-family HTH domain